MNTHPVITALDEQLACYRWLARLVEAQRDHVRQMRTEALLDILKTRQEVMDRLKALHEVIAPVTRRWADFLHEIGSESRARAEECIAQSRQLLQQITASDQDDALVLQQQKLSVGREIKQASTARQINRTYAAAAYGTRSARMDVQR